MGGEPQRRGFREDPDPEPDPPDPEPLDPPGELAGEEAACGCWLGCDCPTWECTCWWGCGAWPSR